MAVGTYQLNVNIGGIQIFDTISREADSAKTYESTLPIATAGVIVNRTNDALTDVTVLTAALTNGTYDCFFSSGVKYACEGTIAVANVLTLTNGTGDAFPVNTTICQVSKVTSINTNLDGDEQELFVINLKTNNGTKTKVGHVKFMDVANVLVAELDLVENTPRVWDVHSVTSPITGNVVTHCEAAMNDTVNTATLQIASLEDPTP